MITGRNAEILKKIIDDENFNRYNSTYLDKFESMYKQLLPLTLRSYMIKTLIEEFEIPAKIKDHLMCRLLCRFKDKNIDFIIQDMKIALKSKNEIKRGKVLRGKTCLILYSVKTDTIISIYETNNIKSFSRIRKKW
jgi:hypothetical protein